MTRHLTRALLLLFALACAPAAVALDLDAGQRQWIARHPVVRIAPDPDLAPLDGIDANGRQQGLAADYLKLVAARTGLRFEVVRLPTRTDALRALREHRVDLVPGLVADANDHGVLYSSAYLRLAAAIYSRAGEPGFATLVQLGGHSVAATEPWPGILAGKAASLRVRAAPDIAAALLALRQHEADAYVGDTFTTTAAIDRLKLGKDVVLTGQTDVEAVFTLAIRADWPQLQAIIDAALKSLSADDDRAIRSRWLQNVAVVPPGAAPEAPALPPSLAKAIGTALDAAKKSQDLPAEARKQVEDLLTAAQADDESADELAQQWQDLGKSAATADAEAQKIEDRLGTSDASATMAWRAALPERATVAEVETLLSSARDALAAARGRVAALESEVARQTSRPFQLRSELATAQTALSLSRSATTASGEPAIADALDLRNRAAGRLAAVRVALLQLENSSYEPRMRLLNAQLHERQREAAELGRRESVLENLMLDRAKARAAELRERVTRERDEALAQFRILGAEAGENLDIVDRLVTGMDTFNSVRLQKQDWDTWLHDTTQALNNTEERIQIGGVSEAVGLILLAEKSRLKPLPLLRRSLARLQTDLAQTRIGLVAVREQVDQLNDLGEAVTQTLARLPEPPPERRNALRTAVYRLLETRAEILPRLLLLNTRLAASEGDAEQALRDLVATTEKLGAILDSRLLWTPSHRPVDSAWPRRLAADAVKFFEPRRWVRVSANVATQVGREPWLPLAVAFVLAMIVLARRRMPQLFAGLTKPMRRIRTDSYVYTGRALVATLLFALPLPGLIALLAWLCRQVPSENGNLTEEVGFALSGLIAPAFALSFLRGLTIDNGLAQAHFRWPLPRRQALRRAVPWLTLIVLPVQFLLTAMLLRSEDWPVDTIGRLLLTGALLAGAILLWRVLAPGRLWTVRGATLVEPLRLRQAARIAGAGGCVLLAALVMRGYFVTALTLSGRGIATLAAALLVGTVYGLAVRWLVLGERRLALKRMEQKQEAEEQRETVEGEALPEIEPDAITLASVGAQTRNLLRLATIIGTIALLLWVWSDVTPAVALLDTIPVWKEQNVTLLGVLKAAVVLAVTIAATRNLPGLIEVGLLRRIHVDAATRYAVTSLTRYVLVFAGTIVGLSLLGLRWSNLQWLAAGFSVGLGFGLQEIFANFISGLMVLFERPIRVGDIVTIGTIEGTVTRIRTRATTIVDWDNREVIVPNKSFITDRLVNWTLSDSVTRIVIKVGIAYRNDPREAQRLLLEVARSHPLVLAQPEPLCWMTGFGASSQDFELRAFVAEIAQRNPVKTELQMRIAEVFRAHDIEIAFPQMDLWMRSDVPAKGDADTRKADTPPAS